jgi:hypothetical protein
LSGGKFFGVTGPVTAANGMRVKCIMAVAVNPEKAAVAYGKLIWKVVAPSVLN